MGDADRTDEPPFRLLSPSGVSPHSAVLMVPGCSGFAANGGINVYDERAADLQTAGYLVVYVDYIGKPCRQTVLTSATLVGRTAVAASWLR